MKKPREPLKNKIRRFIRRMRRDYAYRTITYAYSALATSIVYAAFNLVMGRSSAWFAAFAGYYTVLSLARFLLLRYRLDPSEHRTPRRDYHVCITAGVLLLALNFAMLAVVWVIAVLGRGVYYRGCLIYAVSIYSLYKAGHAVYHLFKVRELNSPLLSAIRRLNYADASVTVLSLQAALLFSFTGDQDLMRRLNVLTGTAACVGILVMAIHMMTTARRRWKHPPQSESEKTV